jgi:hypothetical protein
MVGQASGAVGATVFSHNRYGTYIRRRAKPVIATSFYASNQKALFSTVSRLWNNLPADNQNAWKTWAANNPTTDRLGERQILAGNAAFVRCSALLAAFDPENISPTPPVTGAPDPLTSMTLTADLGAGTFGLAFTPTPIIAGTRLLLWAAIVSSAGVQYVKNLYRLIGASDLTKATPWDFEAILATRLGTLLPGDTLFASVQVYDSLTGLTSLPFVANTPIISTGVPTTLAVTLTPAGAIENGAMWSIDGGVTWYDSAAVLPCTPGAKTVTFHAADGYVTPDPAAKTVIAYTANTLTQAYTEE